MSELFLSFSWVNFFVKIFIKILIILNKMGLMNMSDPKFLGLLVSQVQCNIGLVNMSNPKNLNLAASQAHGNMGLTNIYNPKNLVMFKF